jgi:AmmeMemoRadiSam system protein B
MSVRTPAVAGTFYPGTPEELGRAIDGVLGPRSRQPALGIIVPHAGYVYSGRVAGAVYGQIEIPRDVVLLCFNHRGRGGEFALWPDGGWRTPLGVAPVNPDLALRIKKAFAPATFDVSGHLEEHSGEVQVPFLQRLRPDVQIVPVALSVGLDRWSDLRAFGLALSTVQGPFLVVASTDLNHYEDQVRTLKKDQAAIAAIERLDEELLRRTLVEENVSMCGFAPTLAAIAYAKARGATRARTVLHETSAQASGDTERVVGYVGMIIGTGN